MRRRLAPLSYHRKCVKADIGADAANWCFVRTADLDVRRGKGLLEGAAYRTFRKMSSRMHEEPSIRLVRQNHVLQD